MAFAFAGDARGLPEDSAQPIHFRADNVEGDLVGGSIAPADNASPDAPTKRVIATGSVQIDQGSMRLEADRVVFERVGDRITLINAEGDPARYRQQIEPGADFVEAHATNIRYRPKDEQIELIGRAWLSRAGDEFRGESIKYDMRQGKVSASGEKDGVEMILQPESLQPGSARGNPSHENSLQPGSARGNPSHEKSLQPGSARGYPSHENSPQPGSARGYPSQEKSSARGNPLHEDSSARAVPPQENSTASAYPRGNTNANPTQVNDP